MDPLRSLIRRFDAWLSRLEHVEPFNDDPRVILRAQEGRLAWEIDLPDTRVPKGSPVLFVHLWNERMILIDRAGPDLLWALRTQRSMLHSFRLMARYLKTTPRLASVRAVGGVIAQIRLHGPDGGRLLLEHLGFCVFPFHRPAGAFGEFWENFLTWWLMWTYNPASVSHRSPFGLERCEFWMTADRFLARFGEP